jgi:hypothetical protein
MTSMQHLDESDAQKLYEATFGASFLISPRIGQLALKKELVLELEGLPQPFVLRGFTYEDARQLRVESSSGAAQLPFMKRSNGEHVGWCLPQGFALTASKRKQQGDVWIHELRAFADPDVDIDLAADDELRGFLMLCEEDAKLGEADGGELPFEAEQFADLAFYGWFARYLDAVKDVEGWSHRAASLNDATDIETLNTLSWLHGLAQEPKKAARVAFTLEEDEPDQAAAFRLPVLMNTRRVSIVCWLDCTGEALVKGERVRGLSVKEVLKVSLDIRDRAPKRTQDPEFVFDPELVIALGRHGHYQVDGPPIGLSTELGMADLRTG